MEFPTRKALRDLVLIALTLGIWGIDAGLRESSTLLAASVAIAAGALATICGYLLHEWGHLIGAWLSRSVVHIPQGSLFLFNYDSDHNTRKQFLVMSCGGFIASGLVVAFFSAALPLHALSGQVAIGLTLAGVLATIVLEFPPAWRVYRGGPIPRGTAYRSASTV